MPVNHQRRTDVAVEQRPFFIALFLLRAGGRLMVKELGEWRVHDFVAGANNFQAKVGIIERDREPDSSKPPTA